MRLAPGEVSTCAGRHFKIFINLLEVLKNKTRPLFRPYLLFVRRYNNFEKKGIPKINHFIARLKLALFDGHEVGFEVGFFVGQIKFFSDIFSVKRYGSACNM